jgi:GNAT superfamily N-acetyltransferase
MRIHVRRVEYQDVEDMRELYRQEWNCQIIHDSALSRGLADPYVILVEGRVGGYGAVWNKIDKDRLTEFYTLPHLRGDALPMFRELLAASRATQIEAQTNIPLMLLMLYDCSKNIVPESILFHDAFVSHLACPDGVFRRSTPEDAALIFPHQHEPVGDWVVESQGAAVATGGFLCHYNPPYGDVFMEVAEPARRKGFGSYLVQEVKRVCYEAGKKPAARCNPANVGSRKTLQRAGFLPCGRLLVGEVEPPSVYT